MFFDRDDIEDDVPQAMAATPAAPPFSPALPAPPDPELEKLRAEQASADNRRGTLGAVGAIGDILSNRNGFGNFFTGKMQAQNHAAKDFAGDLAKGVEDPVTAQQKALAYLQQKDAMAQTASDKDPNSKASLALKALAPRWNVKVTPEMSAYDIKQMIDPKKMMETEAQAAVNLENQKAIHGMDNEARAADRAEARRMHSEDMAAARDDRRATHAEKQKELSSTQAKQRGLYESGQLAEEQYNKAIGTGKDFGKDFDPTSNVHPIDNSNWAPNFLKSDKAIESQAAQSAWIESYLRDASGAAIPDDERSAYRKQFFPVPGDSKDAVANKAALRARKMENAAVAAGVETGHGPVAKRFDKDVLDYARTHNITPDQAQHVKDQRTSAVGQR